MSEYSMLNKQCFCCLTNNGHLIKMLDEILLTKPLMEQNFIDYYTICSGIELMEEDNPEEIMICFTCAQKLQSAFDFRELCKQSYQTLKAAFSNELYDVNEEVLADNTNNKTETNLAMEDDDLIIEFYVDDVKEEVQGNNTSQIGQTSSLSDTTANLETENGDLVHELSVDDVKEEIREDSRTITAQSSETAMNSEMEHDDSILEYYVYDLKEEEQGEQISENVQSNHRIEVPAYVNVSDLESDFVCLHCDLVLATHREYLKHYNQHKPYRVSRNRIRRICTICHEETSSYVKHLHDKHKDYRPYKCKYCLGRYYRAAMLKDHLAKRHGNTILECGTCLKKFTHLDGIRRHVATHKNLGHYLCPFCGLGFYQFKNLHEHFLAKHNSKRHLFPCFPCKNIFSLRQHLTSHSCSGTTTTTTPKRTKIENLLTCITCAVKFSSNDEFVCHQFVVPGCKAKKNYTTKAKLTSDIYSGHVSKTYACHTCQIRFFNFTEIRKHLTNLKCGKSSGFKMV